MPLRKSALTARPVSSSAADRRPPSRPPLRQREDQPGGEHAADAGGERQRPGARLEAERRAEDEEERRAERRAAGGADQAGLDDRIAEQRLHQRAADAEAGADEQAEQRAGDAELGEDPLVEGAAGVAGEQRRRGRRHLPPREIERAVADRDQRRGDHGDRERREHDARAAAPAVIVLGGGAFVDQLGDLGDVGARVRVEDTSGRARPPGRCGWSSPRCWSRPPAAP